MNDPEDYRDTPEYAAFIEECCKHCHCDSEHKPCEGVMAGGPCDDMHEEEAELYADEYASDDEW